ncbi:MAG: DegT/DnrJ/EryC1/StrS aminotransferase family protein [Leptospiraceae bacterium]|nr:DegT/DnrJ/EryC1/StrS aminotransferase family protein [Leptospiraceae bacterium]
MIAEKNIASTHKQIEYHKPTFSKEELQIVLDCLVDDLVGSGTVVEKFEKDFKSTFKLRQVISTNSLFSAYHLSLLSLGVTEGDSILLSSYAPHEAIDAIMLLRANPVVVDLGKSSFGMDEEDFHKKLKQFNPKVILFDHTFGSVVNLKNYQTEGIHTIEDYSEALGADSEEIPVGKQGTISICGLSSMNVITTGNGAVINTQNDSIAEAIRSYKYSPVLRKKGQKIRFDYNLLDIHAAIGIEQISKLGVIIERKKKIAQVYLQAVLSASHETYFNKSGIDQYNRFPIVFSKPFDEVLRYFKSLLIGTERTSTEPIHRIFELPNQDFPNSERLFQRGHCIPIYPNLTRDNVSRIASSIKGIY